MNVKSVIMGLLAVYQPSMYSNIVLQASLETFCLI